MRITHIFKAYYPVLGGIENHIRWLAKEQDKQGHQVRVIACANDRSSREWMDGKVEIHTMARSASVSSMPMSMAMAGMIRTESTEILHIHAPFPFGSIASLMTHRAVARVMTYHCDVTRHPVLERLYRPIQHHVLRRMDGVIVTSDVLRMSSVALSPVRERAVVIPLGIPLTDMALRQPVTEVHPGLETRLLFLGKLRHYKGLDILLKALSRVPNASLTIAGTGEMEGLLKEQIRRSGLNSRVTFAGRVDESTKWELFRAADIFILPSTTRSEAFGLAMLEAMAAGLPVISTEIGTGTSWVNQHGMTGLVVEPNNPKLLAEALNDLVSDPEERIRMGRQGQLRCRQLFSAKRMADSVTSFYESILSRVS